MVDFQRHNMVDFLLLNTEVYLLPSMVAYPLLSMADSPPPPEEECQLRLLMSIEAIYPHGRYS